jgi:hypothetical protein
MRGYQITSHGEALRAAWWLLHWSAYGCFYGTKYPYTSHPTADDDRDAVMDALSAYMKRNHIPQETNTRTP